MIRMFLLFISFCCTFEVNAQIKLNKGYEFVDDKTNSVGLRIVSERKHKPGGRYDDTWVRYGCVDKDGNEIIPTEYEDITLGKEIPYILAKGNYYSQTLYSEDGKRCYIKDKRIKEITPKSFKKYKCVIVDRAWADFHYGIMDINSEMIVPYIYGELCWVDEEKGYLAGCWNKKWSVIDYKGNIIQSLPYSEVGEGKNGIILAKNTDGKWGAVDINDNNRILIPFEYSELFNFNGWTLWAEKNDKCALLSINGKKLLGYDYLRYNKSKQNYDEISLEKSVHLVKHWIKKRYDDKFKSKYYIDDNGQKHPTFEEAEIANRSIRGKEENVIDESLASLFWPNIPDVILQQEYELNIGIKSDSKIESVTISVNGIQDRGIKTVNSSDNDLTINRTLTLNEGTNIIKVSVRNAAGTTQEEKTIVYRPQGGELPTIEWLDFAVTANKKEYQMKLGIKSKTKVEEVNVTVNGALTRGIKPVPTDGYDLKVDRTLALSEGLNRIVVSVRNGDGIATSEKVITYKGDSTIINDKRIALVMGNANYNDSDKKLNNPVNDATDLANKLEGLGFTVIRSLDQTKKGMETAINEFGQKAGQYDVALFYYAGHGIRCNGDNYLVPIDADLPDESFVEYNCTNANLVLSIMDKARCPMKIVILDACRNNPFARSWHRSTNNGGLNMMHAPKGTFIAFSTGPGDVANDGVGQRNSPYTLALLQTLDIPNLSITDFFERVGAEVMQMTKQSQTPWTSSSFTGNFYFNKQ